MKVYIARHGETNENAAGIVQGWLDTELNNNGIEQATVAAEHFNENIEAIYSSDLQRASRTAQEFTKKYINVPYSKDARLRERNFGKATGTHRDEYDWERFWSLDDTVTIDGAETLNDFTARVNSFLDELRTQPYEAVLLVAHGGVLNRIQAILNPSHTYIAHKNASIISVTLS